MCEKNNSITLRETQGDSCTLLLPSPGSLIKSGWRAQPAHRAWDPLEQVPPRPHGASPCPGLLVCNLRDTVAMTSQEDGDHELN